MDVTNLVKLLRTEGSDTEALEATRAAGGMPSDLAPLVSAFANRPGGGTIIFGLDEKNGFAAQGVFDAKVLKQGVADLARNALSPPVTLSCEMARYEGKDLVVVTVVEAPATHKPVMVKRTGQAYMRQYDGTFPLSEQEVQTLIANRGQPEFDLAPVDATLSDLDPDAIIRFVREQRAALEVFGGWDQERILYHTRVMTVQGTPTAAGLLAFGLYPQGVLPNSGIQASCWTGPTRKASSQLIDSRALAGSIPVLLEQTVAWVARNTSTAIEARSDGHLYDHETFPRVAVRELVANALVHRDLSPYAANTPVSVILEPDQLIITNPGGLFGLTVAALGKTDSHLRNPHLAQLLLTARAPDGQRVIERLGSGIPRAISALEEAGMAPPIFHDTGLRFTVRIRAARAAERQVPSGPVKSVSGNENLMVSVLTNGDQTVSELSRISGLSQRQVRYVLTGLQARGRVASYRTPGSKQFSYTLK